MIAHFEIVFRTMKEIQGNSVLVSDQRLSNEALKNYVLYL